MARGHLERALPSRGSSKISLVILLGLPCLVALSGALGSLPDRSLRASEATPPLPVAAPKPPTTSCADDLEELRLGLQSLRRGEKYDEVALVALAERLEELCDRTDASRVTRHLSSLAPSEALAAGKSIERIQVVLDSFSAGTAAKLSEHREDASESLEELVLELDLLADPLPAAYARRILADLHLRAGDDADPKLAEALAEDALKTFESVGFHEQEVEVLEVLARAHLAASELRPARAQATKGLELARRIEDSLYESLFLGALVRVADRTGTGLERERLLREWGGLARDPERCDIQEWWAWTQETVTWLIDEDYPQQALTFFEDSIFDRLEATGVDPRTSATLKRQARVLEATILIRAKDFERASELLSEGAPDDRTRLLRAYLDLRRLESADEAAARELRSELTDLLEEGWVSTLPTELLDEGEIYSAELHLKSGRPELARAALERAAKRAIQLDHGLASRSSMDETPSMAGEALGLHAVQLLARAYLALDRPLLAARMIEELQARSLREGQRALEEKDIIEWATHSEQGLVTWVLGPDEGVAIWIGGDGQTGSLLIPFGRRAIQRAVSRLSQALRDGRDEDSASFGAELARQLFPSELRERLSAASGESLMLLTHGPLETLPVSALRVSRTGSTGDVLLCEVATLRVLPGLPSPDPGEVKLESAEWILAGAPTDLDGETRLPAALAELRQIRERRRCALLTGPRMTRAAMISAIEEEACLHVATHVEWVDTMVGPAPALELADGVLFTVHDLPSQLGARELVVLAGCESAGGQMLDGEGVLGFARAFLQTGTRGVVATLWPVSDEVAREFGVALHEELLAKSSPSAALRSACRRLRDLGRTDWAAFHLLGRD